MEVEEQYFNELLIEDQHRELLEKLTEILNGIPVPDNSKVIEAITANGTKMQQFVDAVRAIKFPTPQVNVEQIESVIDISELAKTLDKNYEMANKILELNKIILSELKIMNRLKEWQMEFRRTTEGVIISPLLAKQIK